MCGGRSSILHYGPLIETNNLYILMPNGQSPSALLNKSNTPLVELSIKPRDSKYQSGLNHDTFTSHKCVPLARNARKQPSVSLK